MDQFSLGFLGFWIVTGMSVKLDMGKCVLAFKYGWDLGSRLAELS